MQPAALLVTQNQTQPAGVTGVRVSLFVLSVPFLRPLVTGESDFDVLLHDFLQVTNGVFLRSAARCGFCLLFSYLSFWIKVHTMHLFSRLFHVSSVITSISHVREEGSSCCP